MTDNTVRLANGQRWTAKQFVDHYFEPTGSGVPTPVAGRPSPVDVDKSWYMDEGPGRYYHPGMFPVMHQIIDNRNLAPGTYDLRDFVPNRNEKHPSLTANVSNYTTDVRANDYPLRALVFGNESAKISGQVVANPDGSKTFKQIEIRPLDTDFDFEPNTRNPLFEVPRAIARRAYDPESLGASYDIQYRGPGPNGGTGRIYDPFSDSQLNAALRKEFVYPGSGPAGLLPSLTGKSPLPFVDAQRQYLGQTSGTQGPVANVSAPSVPVAPPANQTPSNDIGNWLASLAGVNPSNPTRPAREPLDDTLRDFYRDDPAWLLQLRR